MSVNYKKPLLGAANNSLMVLIAINAIVFIILNFLRIVYALGYENNYTAEQLFNNEILSWFVLPNTFKLLLTKPWTIISYMFSTYSVWMLISNMLWLWAFGYILQDLAGNKKLIPIYLYGGILGAIVFISSSQFIPYLQSTNHSSYFMIGGGASVMAIAVATTTLAPNYKIFSMLNGGISLWVITLLFMAIDFASVSGNNGATALAHLTGAAVGFIFMKQINNGKDWGAWMYCFASWLNNLFHPKKKEKQFFYKQQNPPYIKHENLTQKKLDIILEKIHTKGYDMLTKDEKDFLDKYSNEQ